MEYSPSVHSGHVATDDKARLEQLAMHVSAPPEDTSTSDTTQPLPHHHQSSAPEWHDEDLDDFAVEEDNQCDHLPPPPASVSLSGKGKEGAYYENYSYSFEEDIAALEPVDGISAPPFEEKDTMEGLPEFGEGNIVPSAPPLEEMDGVDVDGFEPSAPPLDDDPEPVREDGPEVEVPSQNHDRQAAAKDLLQVPVTPPPLSSPLPTGDDAIAVTAPP
jgi:hypothetical protein